jgi:hypothetical protein
MPSVASQALSNRQDAEWRQRAAKVVPGGMTGHLNAASLPAGYPQFFERGEGCRLWDVDGNAYIDFMCSWGPNLLGHHHPEVDAAARRQQALGDCLNGPTPRFVELAERFVARSAHADWVLFQKNGTDATTVSLMVARAATGKRKVLVATKAYHGADPWCTPVPAGVTPEDRAHLIHYTYNDVASLEAAADAAGNDLAAIVCAAFKHDLGVDQELAHARVRPPCARALRQGRRRAHPRRGARRLSRARRRQLGNGGRAPRPQRLEQVDRQRLRAGRRHRHRRAARRRHPHLHHRLVLVGRRRHGRGPGHAGSRRFG